MTTSIQLDPKTFHKRVKVFQNYWKNSTDSLKQVDAVVINVGTPNENAGYQKSTALHSWFLGYEFSETILVLTMDKVAFLTSQKKASLLEPLNVKTFEKQTPIEILVRSKDGSDQDEKFQALLKIIKGKTIGIIQKDKAEGKLIQDWQATSEKLVKVDIASSISMILSIKDEEEQRYAKTAADVGMMIMKDFYAEEFAHIIDEEKKVSHDKLAAKIDECLAGGKKMRNFRLPTEVKVDLLDSCYMPIIQSGGEYNLKPSAQSNNKNLHFGTIICSLGVRYHSYCSNVARTFLVDPTPEQSTDYKFLLDLQNHLIEKIQPGTSLSAVYESGLEYIKEHRSELTDKVTQSFGFGMGLEFRESDFIINSKNQNTFESGMIFNLAIGLQDLENKQVSDEKAKKYSLYIADTIKVTDSEPVNWTDKLKQLDDISFLIKGEGEDEESEEEKPTRKAAAIVKSKLRKNTQIEDTNESRRRQHQKTLAAERRQEMIELYSNDSKEDKDGKKVTIQKFESYRRDATLPKECRELKIFVDKRAETVLLPIYGIAVPFHIATIKNISKNEEGEFTYLRINFNAPGRTTGKKETQFEDSSAQFIKSLSFRNSDSHHINTVFKEINELKKAAQAKENEKKETADLVEQASLVEIKGRKPIRLADVHIRPSLEGKKVPGDLEIHSNGVRYRNQVKSEVKIDILFSNVKHLVFQPCEAEMIVLLHFHLKNPIMIGKKKTKDIQFYREALDAIVEDTGGRRKRTNYGDEDELAQEQEERRKRNALDEEFKSFSDKIHESFPDLSVDVPFRELGFYGVPFRQNVLMQPTTECLINLSEPPFFIVTINEVEIVHLERVVFGLKNFDLVFVFKDHSKVPVHINSIPMSSLEHVKDWLDSVDIVFAESNINFNWTNIMKTINDDPVGFYEIGGWAAMQPDNKDVDLIESSDPEPESETYEESEEEEEFSDSDQSEEEEEVDSEEFSEEFDEEEEADDWSDMEEEAEEEDRKKAAKREEPQSKKQRR